MRRREFLGGLAGAAAAWPLAGRAQQPMPVVGYFSGRSLDSDAFLTPFRSGLEEAGYIVDRNVALELGFSEGRDDQLRAVAEALLRRQVVVLVAGDFPSALAATAATTTTPIVFSSGSDPVELGLVASHNRPGRNATGVHVFVTALGPKRLNLLRELVPGIKRIAFVVNPTAESAPLQIREMQAAAQALAQDIVVMNVANEQEAEMAFAVMAERKVDAVLYSASLLFQVLRDQLVRLAARHRIPAMYEWRAFVSAGGLISYSTRPVEIGRQMGSYVARTLKGEEPADLPVVQVTKFEMAINLKTAKALGLDIHPQLLARADEVIE